MFELKFSHSMIPTISRFTRATINTATTIDHCITKTVLETEFKSGIIKLTYRLIFLLYLASKQTRVCLKNIMNAFFYKRYYDKKSTNLFKKKLHQTT